MPGIPAVLMHQAVTHCAVCGVALGERYGWCRNCQAGYCFDCGRAHFCLPECPANGCYAGLCVREVVHGQLSERWGLPPV